MCTFLFSYFLLFFHRRAVNVSEDCSEAPQEHPRHASCQTEEADLSRLLQLLKEKDGAIYQLQQEKLMLEFSFQSLSVRGDSVFHSLTEYSVKYFLAIFNFFKLEEALTSPLGAPKMISSIDQFN